MIILGIIATLKNEKKRRQSRPTEKRSGVVDAIPRDDNDGS